MQIEPRVHVAFASEASKAVILCRGPSKWVHVLLWDTDSDSITPGAWFAGRIYEQGCSVSPDGTLFAYFATKYGGNKTRGVDYAWTAVSKPPWLTALALWPHDDTWGGNASFVDNKTLIIDCPHWDTLRCDDILPNGFTVLPRWIGRGAPPQSLPEVPTGNARFANCAGVDQLGRSFRIERGRLFRDETVIADFTNLQPSPERSPTYAHSW